MLWSLQITNPFKHSKPRKGELIQNSKTYSNTPDDKTEQWYSKKTEQELPDFYCFHFLSFIS